MTRRFEFVGGKSAKFYEVVVAGSSVTVRYPSMSRWRLIGTSRLTPSRRGRSGGDANAWWPSSSLVFGRDCWFNPRTGSPAGRREAFRHLDASVEVTEAVSERPSSAAGRASG